jgi:hypothetical protein
MMIGDPSEVSEVELFVSPEWAQTTAGLLPYERGNRSPTTDTGNGIDHPSPAP